MKTTKPFSVRSKTRETIARELIARLARGPIIEASPGEPFTPEFVATRYRLWFSSWIEDDLRYLLARDAKPQVG